MGAWLEQTLAKLRGKVVFLRSDMGSAKVEGQHTVRLDTQIAKKEAQLQADIKEGRAKDVVVDEEKIALLITKKAESSRTILLRLQSATLDELLLLRNSVDEVKRSQLTHEEKKSIITHIFETEFTPFEKEFTSILSQEASIENINLSLFKALGNASLNQTLVGELRISRRDVNKTKKVTKKLASAARRSKVTIVKSLLRELDADTKVELKRFNDEIEQDFISLQRSMGDMKRHMETLEKLRKEQGFPPSLEEPEMEKLKKHLVDVKDNIQRSINVTRDFLSDALHIEADVKAAEREEERAA